MTVETIERVQMISGRIPGCPKQRILDRFHAHGPDGLHEFLVENPKPALPN